MKKFMLGATLLFALSSFATPKNVSSKKNAEIIYNNQGEAIGTSTNCDFDKIPKDAIYTITTKYTFPEYNLKECIEFTDAYGDKRYIVAMNSAKERLVFDISVDGEVSIASRIRK